jgi:hypothetical protein
MKELLKINVHYGWIFINYLCIPKKASKKEGLNCFVDRFKGLPNQNKQVDLMFEVFNCPNIVMGMTR